jgi:hypothetical protein
MRQRKVNGEAIPPVVLLELVDAARHWLTFPEAQAARRGALANLDLLERLLTGRTVRPRGTAGEQA